MGRYFGKTGILIGSHPEEKKISFYKSFCSYFNICAGEASTL